MTQRVGDVTTTMTTGGAGIEASRILSVCGLVSNRSVSGTDAAGRITAWTW